MPDVKRQVHDRKRQVPIMRKLILDHKRPVTVVKRQIRDVQSLLPKPQKSTHRQIAAGGRLQEEFTTLRVGHIEMGFHHVHAH